MSRADPKFTFSNINGKYLGFSIPSFPGRVFVDGNFVELEIF